MNSTDFLKANEHKSEVGFVIRAKYIKDNWSWLKYSYAIAIKVRSRMKELGMTQKELDLQLGCTQQHVSFLLGGKVNMTLETMAKLEGALSFDLIGQSLLEFNYASAKDEPKKYLNDSAVHGSAPAEVNTSDLVCGYKPRRKKGPKQSK